MNLPLKGSCQCGAVHYEVEAEPLLTYACHCYSCQKRTGTAFSLALIILTDSLQLSGEISPWERTSDTGSTNTRYSCAKCGNIIYGIGQDTPSLAKLQAGTLEDTRDVEPEVHIWARSRQAWVTLNPQVKQFETQPEDMLEVLQAAQEYRANKQ